jgi:HAMP domain-containing protein
MKKRIRATNVEALIREIERYRAQLQAGRPASRPPQQRGTGKSAK